jgi:GT2 family glycosyltransferase/glycosyltransferase involved in cell wall biosynthesis
VVVVTYNSAPLLPGLFSSLAASLEDVSHELIVVDNASTDVTRDVIRQREPTARLIALDRNLGYAAGINAGIAAASDRSAVVVMNPDVRPCRGCVAHLLHALRDDGVGITVPRLLDAGGQLALSLRRRPSIGRAFGEALLGGMRAGRYPMLGEVVTNVDAYDAPTTADWASGAMMAISRECLASVGAWNEDFFLYSEETEFCARASNRGFALRLVPEAEAEHIGGEMEISPRLWAMQVCNRVRLYRHGHGRAATAFFRMGVALNEVTRAVRGSDVHRAGLVALISASHRPVEVAHPLSSPSSTDLSGTAPSPTAYVCFSAQDWWYHNRAHSDIQLMKNIAASRRVLFINSIAMRMPLPGRTTKAWRRIWRKAKSMAKLVRRPESALPGFHVMTPLTLPFYGSAWARRISASFVRLQVRLVTLALRMPSPVYVVTIPTAYDVVATLPRTRLLYNRSDLHSSFPEADRELIRSLEEALLRESDAVLYVSRALRELERDRVGGQAIFLDHGVDVDHFSRVAESEEPADLRVIPHPRVGFFGGLDDYIIDFDLLEALARALPEAHLVLIGDATCSMRRFDTYSNVHWLGYRPYEEIPKYGSGFDVALMPWLRNEWIEHSNPIKLKEYLSLGLPIVSTEFPEAHYYGDFVRIGQDHDSFVIEVQKALTDPPSVAVRRQSVIGATWQQRACDLIMLAEGEQQHRGA